jgi:hypothetical protein
MNTLLVTQLLKIFPKSYGTLPCSQESVTGPYPEPDEFTVQIISIRSISVSTINNRHIKYTC